MRLIILIQFLFMFSFYVVDCKLDCANRGEFLMKLGKTIDTMSCDELDLEYKWSKEGGCERESNIVKEIYNKKCYKPKPIIPKECYSCIRIGSGNEYVSGVQNGCDGTGYECDIFGGNCNTCWTNNPNSMKKWCEGNNFHDKDNNKDIRYKVQRVGVFNCETRKCWPGSHCGW